MRAVRQYPLVIAGLLLGFSPGWAAVTGRVAGTVKDQSGGVIPGAKLTITNTAQGFKNQTTRTETESLHS